MREGGTGGGEGRRGEARGGEGRGGESRPSLPINLRACLDSRRSLVFATIVHTTLRAVLADAVLSMYIAAIATSIIAHLDTLHLADLAIMNDAANIPLHQPPPKIKAVCLSLQPHSVPTRRGPPHGHRKSNLRYGIINQSFGFRVSLVPEALSPEL